MSQVPEDIMQHNFDTLQENIIHHNPVAARIFQLAEQLHFTRWPSDTSGPLAVEGGLLIHSVETAMLMMQLHRVLDPRIERIPLYSVMLVGLLHDVGKCGVEKYSHYEQVPCKVVAEDPEVEDRARMEWRVTPLGRSEGHVALGLSLFESAGVPLSREEKRAIALHGTATLLPDDASPLGTLLFFANKWNNWFVREPEVTEYARSKGHTGRK